MGFLLSLLYIVTCYLAPVTLFGPLAHYRIELILAVLVVLVSLPSLANSIIFKTPQSIALIGLAIAVMLSIIMGVHWLGGAIPAFFAFLPNAFAFYIVCLHLNSRKRLQALVALLVFVCFFVITHGIIAEIKGFPPALTRQPGFEGSRYLFAMQNNAGKWFYRIRGLGEIHDPNDFGQLIVSLIPLVFIFWRRKKVFSNFLFVILPVVVLLLGTYLTHSRGALLALLAIVLVAIWPRIGTVASAIIAAVLLVAAKVFHFAGGRSISLQAGAQRTELWGDGMRLFKHHLLFGVGFGHMPEYTPIHRTAHNSIVVCAAELGMIGLYFWSLYLLPTARNALVIASPKKVTEPVEQLPEETLFPGPERKLEISEKSEVIRLGRIMVLSLTGYFVTAWFLSRAYTLTLFLLGGIAEVLFEMALRNGMVAPRLKFERVLLYAGILAIALILTMYVMLRVVNFIH